MFNTFPSRNFLRRSTFRSLITLFSNNFVDIVEVRYFDCGSLEVVWIFWRRFFRKDEIKMKHFERDKIVWMNCTLFSRGIFSENPFSKTICLSNFFSWCRKKVEALTTVVRWSVSILFKSHGILYYIISRGLNLFSFWIYWHDLDHVVLINKYRYLCVCL